MVKEAKHRSWGITSRGSHLRDEKRAPGGLGIILPNYVWIIISHYKDPYLNKRYFMECHKFFFFRLADCRGDFWRSVRVKHWYSEWILEVFNCSRMVCKMIFFQDFGEKKPPAWKRVQCLIQLPSQNSMSTCTPHKMGSTFDPFKATSHSCPHGRTTAWCESIRGRPLGQERL